MSYSPCDFSDDVLSTLRDEGLLSERDIKRLEGVDFDYHCGEIACKAIKRMSTALRQIALSDFSAKMAKAKAKHAIIRLEVGV